MFFCRKNSGCYFRPGCGPSCDLNWRVAPGEVGECGFMCHHVKKKKASCFVSEGHQSRSSQTEGGVLVFT